MQEIWQNVHIEGYERFYAVSNLGNVKRLCHYVWFGGITHDEHIMKQQIDSKGYPIVTFTVLGKQKTVKVHRLVATAFIPNPDNLPQVNHKDGNKTNNKVSNLEWCTLEYNVIHAHKNHLIPRRKTKPVYQFDLNGNKIKKWKSMSFASKETGIVLSSIYNCCIKKSSSAGGYFWSYDSVINKNEMSSKRYRIHRCVKQYDLDGNYIATYNSCAEAAKCVGTTQSSIYSCCTKTRRTAKNFIWEFE